MPGKKRISKKQLDINKLEEAREHLECCIELVHGVFREDNYVEAYFLDKLRIMAYSYHGFLSSELDIDELIERLNKKYDENILE